MKVLAYILIIFLVIAININVINAQATLTSEEQSELITEDKPVEITDVQGLRADFVQNTQNPGNKKAKFEMILKAGITSDRVRITWTVTGSSRAIDETQLSKTIRIEAGKTYTLPLEVVPSGQGVTEVYGVARVFGVESNIVATVRKNYATNASREILPITSEYKNAKTMNLVINIAKYVVGALVLIFGGLIGFKKLVRWYKVDERAAYDSSIKN